MLDCDCDAASTAAFLLSTAALGVAVASGDMSVVMAHRVIDRARRLAERLAVTPSERRNAQRAAILLDDARRFVDVAYQASRIE